jgi:hypothetical protein
MHPPLIHDVGKNSYNIGSLVITQIFKYILWVIADYWDLNPVTNIALQGRDGVVETPSASQVYLSIVIVVAKGHHYWSCLSV